MLTDACRRLQTLAESAFLKASFIEIQQMGSNRSINFIMGFQCRECSLISKVLLLKVFRIAIFLGSSIMLIDYLRSYRSDGSGGKQRRILSLVSNKRDAAIWFKSSLDIGFQSLNFKQTPLLCGTGLNSSWSNCMDIINFWFKCFEV